MAGDGTSSPSEEALVHADRRKILTWGIGSIATLGAASEAGGQTADTSAHADAPRPPNASRIEPIQPDKVLMQHPFVDNIVMLAELTVKPGLVDDFLAYTVENLRLSRSARGNLAFDILIDETRPNTVMFYEVWASQKDQQDYMTWRVQAGDLTKLLSFLVGTPKFTRLRSIAA